MNGEFDGITIKGESVESFLTDDFSKDVAEAKKEKVYRGRKVRARYMDHKEPHGEVKSKRHAVLARLLTHVGVTSEDVFRMGAFKHKNDCATMLRSILRSEFGHLYMERTGTTKGYTYRVPEVIEDTGVKFSDITMDIDLAYKLSCQKSAAYMEDTKPVPAPKANAVPRLTATRSNPVEQDININVNVTFHIKFGGVE